MNGSLVISLLVFCAGLVPFENDNYPVGLYIIGYFTVKIVIDFNELSPKKTQECYQLYPENAHSKRRNHTENLVIVVGQKDRSGLLNKAILISAPKRDKGGRTYYAASPEMETLLGIEGSIQRSAAIRTIEKMKCLNNLKRMLGL